MARGATRRGFLALGVAAQAVDPALGVETEGDLSPRSERAKAVRVEAAQTQGRRRTAPRLANGDEQLLPGRIGSFAKGLPHSPAGEVESAAYDTLLHALSTGLHADFEAIRRGSGRRLANPMAAFAYHLEGGDPHSFSVLPAPAFVGVEMAREVEELYWQSLCRDVPFSSYRDAALVRDAATALGAAPSTVFRGPTPGDLAGPYISQFLWKPIPDHSGRRDQRYRMPIAGSDFMTTRSEWLHIQTGLSPWRQTTYDETLRYIRNGRDLAEWVHYDFMYEPFLNAALILLDRGPGFGSTGDAVLSPHNPYKRSKIQEGFVTFGVAEIVDWLGRVTTAALKAAWVQKWLVHRRLRPEAFGWHLHRALVGDLELTPISAAPVPWRARRPPSGLAGGHPALANLWNSEPVRRVHAETGTYLLPQAYPEGSPMHPSYPAGHATVAGACATILKAFFDEDALIPDCVETSADGLDLFPCPASFAPTVGSEVDKLAFNFAMARNWAGIHYRSDARAGLELGQEVALALLLDLAQTCSEDFSGFELKKFDGTPVRITV